MIKYVNFGGAREGEAFVRPSAMRSELKDDNVMDQRDEADLSGRWNSGLSHNATLRVRKVVFVCMTGGNELRVANETKY